jgi:phage shock protein A
MGEESKWAQLEGGTAIDDELAALKAQLSGTPTPSALPSSTTSSTPPQSAPVSAVDDELEQLRQQLNKGY